jgi:hypothetical protein
VRLEIASELWGHRPAEKSFEVRRYPWTTAYRREFNLAEIWALAQFGLKAKLDGTRPTRRSRVASTEWNKVVFAYTLQNQEGRRGLTTVDNHVRAPGPD